MAGLWKDITSIGNQIYNILPAKSEVEKVVIKEVDMLVRSRTFVRVAGVSGAAAVAMAAYGAHGFNQSDVDERLKRTYEIGNRMHLLHSVAILASPLANRPFLVGTLLTAGVCLFSGSCYYHALTGNQRVRQVTPYGGMLLIFGWLAMVF